MTLLGDAKTPRNVRDFEKAGLPILDPFLV